MRSLYALKPRFQALLLPVLPPLVRLRISPDAVTLAGVSFAAAAGGVIAWRAWGGGGPLLLLLVPPALLLRTACEAIDGMLARALGRTTPRGEALNEMGGAVSEGLVLLPLAAASRESAEAVVLFAFLALLSELAGVLAARVAGDRRVDGPMGKADRAALVASWAVLVVLWPAAAPRAGWLFGAGSALAALTIRNRLRGVFGRTARETRDAGEERANDRAVKGSPRTAEAREAAGGARA